MKALRLLLVVFALVGISVSVSSQSHSKADFENIVQAYGHGQEINLDPEDAKLSVPEIIAKYGYPIEIHEVTTPQGYIWSMHRIPYGKRSGPAPNKPVVWLQHGLLCDSSNWIMNNEDKALAYVLADLGYDVWLGNARGNTYSKKHVSLSSDDPKFWEFSWHEMGTYDVPAVLDYILTTTGKPDIYYVGHSMGTTMFFVAMSMNPSLNSKIKLMSALAPVAYMEFMDSPLRIISPFVNQIEWLLEFMGLHEFLPSNALMDLLGATICRESSPIQAVCSNVLFLLSGYNVDQLNTTSLPIILGHTPAGASVRSVTHYAQLRNSKVFGQYDHGRDGNLEVYGTPEPPQYDLSKITAPVAFYWGDNDWLAADADVYRLAEKLPNLVRKYRIRHDKYNHLDFLWAMDNHVLLNDEVVEFLKYY